MNQRISTNQIVYSVSAFILASNLLTSNLYQFARNDSWLSVLGGFAASFLIISILITLTKRYPGLGLFEINTAVFGKIIGKAVSALYVFFFLSLAILNTRDLGDFVKMHVLQRTPSMIVFIIFILLCAWAVRKGPVNMTSYGFLSTFVTIAAIMVISLLLINRYKLENLLPVLTLPVRDYLIGAHIVTMLPFCETVTFAVFIPFMHRPQEFGQAMRKGLVIAAVLLLIVVLRDAVVLGKFLTLFTMPSYYTARYIDVGDILTRLEIVYAIILVSLMFFKVSIVYYAGVSGMAGLFGLENYQPFVYVIGALICVYAAACFKALIGHVEWKMTVAATYSTFFIVVLPLVTLIVSLVRNRLLPKEKMINV